MTVVGDGRIVGTAGASAQAESELALFAAAAISQEVARLRTAREHLLRRSARFATGSTGERAVWAAIDRHLSQEWSFLIDRRWPGTRSANIDFIVVGPGGVFVLDAKNWAEPRVENGRLLRGSADCTDELDKVRSQASAIANALQACGLSPNEVHPVIVLAGHALAPIRIDDAYVVGEQGLAAYWAAHGSRLDPDDVAGVVRVLEAAAPPVDVRRPTAVPRPAPVERPDPGELLTIEDIVDSARRVAESGTIERWMSWLDPHQSSMVSRSWNGPARIRGAAGTGKTVVALHRAQWLARRGRSVLMTSYVGTLPEVHRALFSMLAPDLTDEVTFKGLHAWCLGYLRSRGIDPMIEDDPSRSRFPLALRRTGALDTLSALDVPTSYWWDEVSAVIKGRGLTTPDEYFATARAGRRVPLQRTHREAVWSAYEWYQDQLRADGKLDWPDVLLLTLSELETDDETRLDAVVVDEVQDLPVVGLRIVSHLTRNDPAGLLLVGDGQQAVYPGGGTLREAGISVTGRSTVLSQNYRNGAAILRRALAVVEDDDFSDLDDAPEPGSRDIDCARAGGAVEELDFDDHARLRTALVDRLRRLGPKLEAAAVLVRSNEQAEDWARLLRKHGIPAIDLRTYSGSPVAAVKVGTYQRAKGLEFALVAIPHHDRAIDPRRSTESAEHYIERAALQRRQLFVAMTRARDTLWLGGVTRG